MSNEKETVLTVDGMTCSACVRHVTSALRELQGVGTVEVNLEDGKVRVRQDGGGAGVDEMIAALNGAGYEAREP